MQLVGELVLRTRLFQSRRSIAAAAAAVVLAVAVIVFVLLVNVVFGGSQNRVALARQTEHSYWNDFGHYKVHPAYMLLTPGVRQALKEKDFQQAMIGLLTSTNGVTAAIGKITVVGDCAQAQLGLQSPKAPGQKLKVWQHLYWIDGGWHISDTNAEVSRAYTPLTSCPTGT